MQASVLKYPMFRLKESTFLRNKIEIIFAIIITEIYCVIVKVGAHPQCLEPS